jgi:hypothetical protein
MAQKNQSIFVNYLQKQAQMRKQAMNKQAGGPVAATVTGLLGLPLGYYLGSGLGKAFSSDEEPTVVDGVVIPTKKERLFSGLGTLAGGLVGILAGAKYKNPIEKSMEPVADIIREVAADAAKNMRSNVIL